VGVLEELINQLETFNALLPQLIEKLDGGVGSFQEEVWERKDLEEFTKNNYSNVKALTSREDFPKFYIGKSERYLKSQVIEYLKNLKADEHECKPSLKTSESNLYRIAKKRA